MYNGYPNRETWSVNLWLNDKPETYYALMEMAETEMNPERLAEQIEEFVWSMVPELDGMLDDLLTTALQSVEWEHIAAPLLEA